MLPAVNSEPLRPRVKIITVGLGVMLIFSILSLANETGKDGGKGNQVPNQTVGEVLEEYTGRLMDIPGVVGTGQGLCKGQPCIKVFVDRKTPEMAHSIPKNLKGHPVVIQETGKIRAHPENQK